MNANNYYSEACVVDLCLAERERERQTEGGKRERRVFSQEYVSE
jgi:hypothetical protein